MTAQVIENNVRKEYASDVLKERADNPIPLSGEKRNRQSGI